MKKPKAIRCRIVDVEGEEYAPGIFMRTPPNSQPHVGKLGYAEREYVDVIGYNKKFSTVKITLDDGNILYGYECWWEEAKEDGC